MNWRQGFLRLFVMVAFLLIGANVLTLVEVLVGLPYTGFAGFVLWVANFAAVIYLWVKVVEPRLFSR